MFLAEWHFLVYIFVIKTLFKLTFVWSTRQWSLGRNHLHNNPQIKIPSREGCLHKMRKLHYRQWESFTPCQIPETESSSTHVKTLQKQKAFRDLGSCSLVYPRFTHQGVSSWWANTLSFNCYWLHLWHGHCHRQGGLHHIQGQPGLQSECQAN